jgi:hypothetical protein
MSKTLKYCVSCQRAVSEADASKLGLNISRVGRGVDEVQTSFARSKKSFSPHRSMRTFFLTSSGVLALSLVYYVVMKFGIKQPLPGNVDIWLQGVINQLHLFR